MKTARILLLFIFATAAFAQDAPLSQQEYVKMLYSLDTNFGEKDSIVEALRRRGINFELTAGIRSLTRTKARNDADLRQALEEADRRRQNPSAAKPPSKAEADELIAKARAKTLEAVGEMPDFVVKQQIQRSQAFAGTNNFRNLDRLVVAVSYRASGQEDYRVLSVNGIIQPAPEVKRSYEEFGGTSSTGEFVTVLATIFKPESDTLFNVVDTALIRERPAVMFDYAVDRDKAKQQIAYGNSGRSSAITGMRGRVWIDRENHRVLRIESEATEIPEGFPITSAKRVIDYDWTSISEEDYLLPLLSDVRLTFRESGRNFETRNVIRFRDYQKFGSEVIILDDDDSPIEEDQP
ncbi:MAG: hypothetical protein H0V76_07915 [Blastocatellia bacterium]|nr:hypothetical protein [Blastocatellia bacterium]